MHDTSEHFLTEDDERLALRIARDALTSCVVEERKIELDGYPLSPPLQEKHGAFVTLRNAGELRGCIGYIANNIPLADAVRDNAISAASRDTRFNPITPDELDAITIEVSALTTGDRPDTPFKAVSDIRELRVGRDGLYIEHPPSRGGILLPQVATEQGWDMAQFLSAVCRKAGYPDRTWENPEARLYRFSAQVFSEEEPPA